MLLVQTIRQTAALALSLLLVGTSLSAQAQAGSTPTQKAVVPDGKRAQKAVERGERAEADGQLDDALADYDEAARYAPQDVAIVGRSATLRSKLVRTHVDNAERLALAGDITQATAELRAALTIDPANAVVYERIAQMSSMPSDDANPEQEQIQGLPRVKAQEGQHNFDIRGDTKTAYEQVASAFGI